MGHRILVILVSVCFAALTSQALALGFGEAKLKSSLNKPLLAEIELLEVRGLSEEEIYVELATSADFERVGVEKSYFLTGLKFKVDLEASSGPIVTVTSKRPVREPFLNFVISAQWPSGKLLREYTLLLDLPVFAEGESGGVDTASSATSKKQSAQTAPARSGNPRSTFGQQSASSSSYAGASYDGETYKVSKNDTLWEIAAAVRPSGSVTVHQTMIAIQSHNPNAFINNNINLLKNGQVLRIPTLEDIQSQNRSGAIEQVAVQNAQWSGSSYSESDGGPQLEAGRSHASTTEQGGSVEGRIKLTSPEDTDSSQSGRGAGGVGDSSTDAIENELAITMEQLDKTRRENTDLLSKVDSLEEQIQTMEKMLEVSNEGLRAIELAAKENARLEEERRLAEEFAQQQESQESDEAGVEGENLVGDEAEEQALSAEEELAAGDSELDGLSEVSAGRELDAASVDVVEELAEEVKPEEPLAEEKIEEKKPAKVVKRAPPQPTLIDTLMDYIVYIGIGLLVLIIALVYFLKTRADDDEFDDFMDEIEESVEEDVEESAEELEEFDSFEEEDEATEELAGDVDELTEESQSSQQTEDVVAEADIYIAYGKFDQAEEMLSSALNRQPKDEGILVKLLEVYSAQESIGAFDPLYAKLRAFGNQESLERASKLRDAFEDVPEFDESLYEIEAEEIGATGESDVITGLDEEDSFELEIDSDVMEGGEDASIIVSSEIVSPEVASTELEDDLSLDISLDLDDGADDEISLNEGSLDDVAIDVGDLASDLELDTDFSVDESFSVEADTATDDLALDLDLDLPEDASVEIGDLDIESELGDDLSLDEASLDGVGDELNLDGDLSADVSDLESGLELDLDSELESASEELLDLDIAIDEGAESDEDVISFDLDDGDSAEVVTGDDLELDLDSDLSLSFDKEDEELAAVDFSIEEKSLESGLANLDEDLDLSIESSSESESEGDIDLGSEEDISVLDGELNELASDLGDISSDDLDLELEAGLDDVEASDSPDVLGELEQDGEDFAFETPEESDGLNLDLDDDLDVLDESLELEGALESEGASEDSVSEVDVSLDLDAGIEELSVDLDQVSEDVAAFDLEEGLPADAPSLDDVVTTEEQAEADTEILQAPETDFGELGESLDLADDSAEVATFEIESDDLPELDTSFETLEEEVSEADVHEFDGGESSEFEFDLPEVDPDADDDDSDLEFLSDSDETATKLDLARAYIDMGDANGAKDILREVVKEGSDEQKQEAEGLLSRIES